MTDQQQANGPTSEQVAKATAMISQIEPQVQAAVFCMLRGLMMSFPGIPTTAVLSTAAFQAGFFMGQAIGGELAGVLAFRKGIQEGFAEGVRRTKPNVMPAPAMPTGPIPLGGQNGGQR